MIARNTGVRGIARQPVLPGALLRRPQGG